MATRTIATATALKRADALAVGDIIPGGGAPKGHRVLETRTRRDKMLGLTILVTVVYVAMDADQQDAYLPVNYTFRPYDKLWVEA